jgi:hypothetical protein
MLNLEIWKFGNLEIWIFGYLDIWIFGYLDIWIFGGDWSRNKIWKKIACLDMATYFPNLDKNHRF